MDGKIISRHLIKLQASAVYTNTGTSEYTPFELKLEYKKDKEYDPNKKYKFAVIFSASKEWCLPIMLLLVVDC